MKDRRPFETVIKLEAHYATPKVSGVALFECRRGRARYAEGTRTSRIEKGVW